MKPTADGMSDYLEANAEKLLSNRWDKRLKASMTILQERSIMQPMNYPAAELRGIKGI